MDFRESPEQAQLRAALRRFLEREAPTHVVNGLDREQRYPQAIVDGLGAMGVWGLCISEEFGGSAADPVSVAIAAEELQRAGGCIASAITPTMTFCAPGVERWGTSALRSRLLPELAAGRMRMSIGLSEPDVGSDLSAIGMRAECVDGGFRVTGNKTWATGADVADYVFALVRTGPAGSRYKGLSVLLLSRADVPMTIRPIPKLASQATHSCEISVQDAFVSDDNLLGEVNAGADIVLPLLETERVICAAQCVGMAQGAFDTAVAYAAEREQFGRPVIEHQAVGHQLTEMAADVEAARLVAYRAAWEMADPSPAHAPIAALAKVFCSRVASSVASRGMEIMGAYSYSTEYPMERYYREVKLFEIAGGTSHILKNVAARRLRPGPVSTW